MKLADTVFEELWFDEQTEDDTETAALEASESMAAKVAELVGLKPFPVVAQKVLDILNRPDFRVLDVTTALQEDPSLAAGVLRMANSAFFAGAKSCNSIQQAFVRLGGRAVKESVMTVATMEMFSDDTGLGKIVRDHCATTAAIVQTLTLDFAPKSTEGIFLSGLMHDIGKMLLMETGEIIYSTSDILETMEPDRIHLDERKLLGYDHAVLAGHVLKSWRIPEPIPQIVAWHHQPTRAHKDKQIGTMVAMLRIADQLDAVYQETPDKIEPFIEQLAQGLDCTFLNITVDDLKSRMETIYHARSDALSLFG